MDCTCPLAGFCPTHNRKMVGRKYEICQGINVTDQRREAYLTHWTAQPVPKASNRECGHRGGEIEKRQCPTCSGHVMVKLFACTVHGECSISKSVGAKVCHGCKDQIPPPVRQPSDRRTVGINGLHLGDIAIYAWIAEGIKDTEHPLRFAGNGINAELLALLGHQTDPLVTLPPQSDYPFSTEQKERGQINRLNFYADWHGVERIYKRPVVAIEPASDIDRRTALLFPDTTMPNRRWPVRYWNELAEGLTLRGWRVLTLPTTNIDQYPTAVDVRPFTNVVSHIAAAGLVIGVDSGPVNWATLFDVPTIAILGPTTAGIFAHAPNVRCLSAPVSAMSCVGCWFQPPYQASFCQTGCLALANILPDNVLEAI